MFGSSLHLSLLDDNVDEQGSHNIVFRDPSTALEPGLALSHLHHNNIDQDRPSQSSGSVLASEGNFAGSIHTVDSARMARPPPSAAVAAQKQVMSSRDVHILLSDSDSDSGIDNGNDSDFMLLDKQEFFSPSRQFKRRAQDPLGAHLKKRPNIQGASSQLAMYEALRSEITAAQVSEWQKGQLPLDEVVSKSWNHVANQMQYLNPSGPRPLSSTYGTNDFSLNYSTSAVAAGRSVHYLKHTVETPMPNRGNARPVGVTYDLNTKNQQIVRSVPATAESIMRVYDCSKCFFPFRSFGCLVIEIQDWCQKAILCDSSFWLTLMILAGRILWLAIIRRKTRHRRASCLSHFLSIK